jgi:hypothetical protein
MRICRVHMYSNMSSIILQYTTPKEVDIMCILRFILTWTIGTTFLHKKEEHT